jgi:hypothetical protein
MRTLLRVAPSLFAVACSSAPLFVSVAPGAVARVAGVALDEPAGSSLDEVARRLREDVGWLADDAQEGRRAGTEAGRRAGEWIAARMRELGLAPAGAGGSYLQEFQVPLPVQVGPGSSVGEVRGAADVMPLFCSSGGAAAGPLEWRGYGIVAADKGWNDYGTRCDGKVVVVVRGTPPESAAPSTEAAEGAQGGNVQAGEGWGNSGSLFLKVMNAKKNGAVAVVVVPHPSQKDEPLPPFDHRPRGSLCSTSMAPGGRGRTCASSPTWSASAGRRSTSSAACAASARTAASCSARTTTTSGAAARARSHPTRRARSTTAPTTTPAARRSCSRSRAR